MTKRGVLSKVEKFYIKYHRDDVSIEDMAKELDRTPDIVTKYVKSLPKSLKPKKEEAEVVKFDRREESQMFKLMGRKKRNDQYVATVMTEAASELADATRPSRTKLSGKIASAIHQPKG